MLCEFYYTFKKRGNEPTVEIKFRISQEADSCCVAAECGKWQAASREEAAYITLTHLGSSSLSSLFY